MGREKNIKIEGFEEVFAEIKTLPDDKVKRQKLLKILRKQMRPILAAVKQNTPVAKSDIKFRDKIYKAGNLRDSMAIKTSRMKHYPNVLVGPKIGQKDPDLEIIGGKNADGFYAFWIQYGTVHQAPNDFIDKAASPLLAAREAAIAKAIDPYIGKEIKKLKL
jgi:HK97 gp10 family phage protein